MCSLSRVVRVTHTVDLELVVRVAHIPFNGNELALSIANDASHVAAKLWVIARKQDKTSENA
jgi:hypothetical protein